VVEALVHAALDPTTPTGIFELAGPEVITVDDFAGVLNRHRARITHTVPWLSRMLAHIVPGLAPTLV
jgi:hypothetical protein